MNWWVYIVITLLVLFFIPFPIIIKFRSKTLDFELYLYKKKINIKKMLKSIKKKNVKPRKKIEIELNDIRQIIHKIDCSKFKPTLRTTLKLRYGLNDAAVTGIFSGILYTLSPVLYRCFTILFKVKEYDFKVLPEYNDVLLDAEIDCIIFINIAKITYMVFLVLKSYKLIKKSKQKCQQSEINL